VEDFNTNDRNTVWDFPREKHSHFVPKYYPGNKYETPPPGVGKIGFLEKKLCIATKKSIIRHRFFSVATPSHHSTGFFSTRKALPTPHYEISEEKSGNS